MAVALGLSVLVAQSAMAFNVKTALFFLRFSGGTMVGLGVFLGLARRDS